MANHGSGQLNRRTLLKGFAVLGAHAVMGRPRAEAQVPPWRVDVHSHHLPPAYLAALNAHNLGQPPMLAWTPAKALEDMDRAGVATAVTSITTPALSFLDATARRRVTRECNEWTAQLVADRKGRFGMFAVVPMPDVDGALKEIAYALDILKADGIGLLTSYGDKWLGDAAFAPVFEELNRRKAVVYTHPTVASCCTNLIAEVRAPVIEYPTDLTRAIASFVFTGSAARFQDVSLIFALGGGTMPYIAERLIRLPLRNKKLEAKVPNGVAYELKRFYYDTAWAAQPMALASLTKLVAASQVLFGSDFPFRTTAEHVKGLTEHGFSAAELRAIDRENAVRLMPRLTA